MVKSFVREVIEKYKGLSAPIKSGLWFTICTVIQRAIALLSTPIFTRILTTEQYGVYSVYQAWYSIVQIFATLNLFYGVFNNGMTKYPNDRSRFTASMQGLSTTITVLLFFVFVIFKSFWNRLIGLGDIYMYAMFAELLFVPAFNFWMAKERYDYKYLTMAVISIVMAIVSPVIGVICVLSTEYKAEARVLSFVAVQVIVGVYFYIYNLKRGKIFYDRNYWKYALVFNIPLIPHYLSTTVLNISDRIMINDMIGSSEAAIYSVAYTIASMMTIVTQAISNSFTPYTYKAIKANQGQNIRKNSIILVFMVAGLCLAAMLFGPEIIYIFASPEYHDAIWVIPPVAASVYFTFLYSLFGSVEFYYEKTKFVMAASSVAALLNILLNYYFINSVGYYAAGYTTVFCYAVYSAIHCWFYKRIIKQNNSGPLFDIKVISFISFGLIILMLIVTVIYQYIAIRYVFICTLIVFCIINRNKLIQVYNLITKRE